jgi:hypothetical protein
LALVLGKYWRCEHFIFCCFVFFLYCSKVLIHDHWFLLFSALFLLSSNCYRYFKGLQKANEEFSLRSRGAASPFGAAAADAAAPPAMNIGAPAQP